MKKIFIIYGHYNDKSFTCAIKDTFIESAKLNGHEIDLVDLYKDKFNPVFAGRKQTKKLKIISLELKNLMLLFLFILSGGLGHLQ